MAIITKNRITAFTFKKMQIVFILLFVMLISAILGISMLNGYSNTTAEQNILVFSYIGLFSLILSVTTWAILRKEIICPYVFYLLACYVFMYGQCLLWALSLKFEYKDLFKWYTPETIFPGQFFSLLCLLALHLGAIISAKDNSKQINEPEYGSLIDKAKLELSIRAIRISAWILFAVSAVPYILSMIDSVIFALNNTYRSYYYREIDTSRLKALRDIVESFFFPSLFMLLIGYQKKRSVTTFVLCTCITFIVLLFITGGRSGAFMLFVTLICAWHYLIKPFKFKQIIFLLLAAYLMFSIGSILAITRNLQGLTFADYIETYNTASEEGNPAATLIAELGWTMGNTIEVMKQIPANYDFRYGSSYFFSLTTIIPNLGFWDIHPATTYANLSSWLQDIMGIGFGPGFSPIAEAYTNFGWFGIIFMALEGAIFGRLLSLTDKHSVKYKPESMTIGLLFLLVALKDATRASAIVMVRSIAYTIILSYLLILFVKFTIKHFSSKSYQYNSSSDSETVAKT